MAMFGTKNYSLRKSRSILKWVYGWYKKHFKQLPQAQLAALEKEMSTLDSALLNKKREEASSMAKQLETFAEVHCKKSMFGYVSELALALIFALTIAIVVRQMWFEPYEIPTGSMRPTFREQDHLTVSKTAFGLNVPLETKHFYFDPDLVQRSSVLIFSGDGLPMPETETTYLGLFPYTKRYIKRLIGKPGDSLYFYGGRIYSVDKDGNDLSEMRDADWMKPLEYIPFMTFDGDLLSTQNAVTFLQFHKPLGKITAISQNSELGEVFNGIKWIKDNPLAQTQPHDTIESYSDFLGIRNFAMARLLTKNELKQYQDVSGLEEGVLYLQLRHTPSLSYPKPFLQTSSGTRVGVPAYTTIIPLQQRHLDAIMDNIYTSRFIVEDGKARLYSVGDNTIPPGSPRMSNVPNGTYEFYHGKASAISWGGVETSVPKDSPLNSHDPAQVQKLFNLGIQMNNYYAPNAQNEVSFPHRYAYFRDGDLYLVGAPILKKDDPTLVSFLKNEEQHQAKGTPKAPYVAFKDYGPPVKEGKIDVPFIRTFGITVPEKEYLVLGDNHSRSSDSRVFGFVPENNLQGAPCVIIWPPGDRWGCPAQKPYPFMNIPRAIVWGIALLIGAIWYAYHRWNMSRPIYKKAE